MAEGMQLIDLGGPAASLTYQLSQGQSLRPESITVAVDGSGAGSDFVVVVSMFAQSGEMLSRTRTDDTITAGEATEATFAPF